MGNKKAIPNWANYLLIIVLAAIIISNAITVVKSGDPFGANVNYICFLNIIACTPAIYYCLSNHEKNASKAYIIFCVVYAITELLKLYLRSQVGIIIVMITPVLVLASLVILCVVKNLGKKKSFILASVVVVSSLVDLIYTIVNYYQSETLYMAQNLVLSICLIVMVYAKYKDKEQRGTK